MAWRGTGGPFPHPGFLPQKSQNMHEFPTSKFFSYFETVTFCFVTFRVKNNVSFASKACVKKLLEFGSQVVTFRVYVTFYVNVTFCGVTAPHCPALKQFFPQRKFVLLCLLSGKLYYCSESHDFNFVNFCILS